MKGRKIRIYWCKNGCGRKVIFDTSTKKIDNHKKAKRYRCKKCGRKFFREEIK